MKQVPKTCQNCKFFTDLVISGYTPYLSVAQFERINGLINVGEHGRCCKHSQMTPEPFDHMKMLSQNLSVVYSGTLCVLVKKLWYCDDWEEKKIESGIGIRGLKTVTLAGS